MRFRIIFNYNIFLYIKETRKILKQELVIPLFPDLVKDLNAEGKVVEKKP